MKKIAICVATFNRNELLYKCLSSLRLAIRHVADIYDVKVIVVDNNECGDAERICEKFINKLDIVYEIEKEAGIPYTTLAQKLSREGRRIG